MLKLLNVYKIHLFLIKDDKLEGQVTNNHLLLTVVKNRNH